LAPKNISTLVEDIYSVFDEGKDIDPKEAETFGVSLGKLVIDRLRKREKPYLRLSNLGKPCLRQLWYSINTAELGEKLSGPARIKFLIGDITEAVVLFLAKLAGHSVTDEQADVEVDGVSGHIDALVDDELVDVKSASPFSHQKFKDGLTPDKDSFGYLTQLASYGKSKGKKRGHFLSVDKVLGNLHLDTHDPLPEIDLDGRVRTAREVLDANTPPPRAFDDVPDGKSGNRKLGVNCSYCEFKQTCWPGLRTVAYANGPRYLTRILREPKPRGDE